MAKKKLRSKVLKPFKVKGIEYKKGDVYETTSKLNIEILTNQKRIDK